MKKKPVGETGFHTNGLGTTDHIRAERLKTALTKS